MIATSVSTVRSIADASSMVECDVYFFFFLVFFFLIFFFFNDTATTEIYTLSLHDALPISSHQA